MIRITGGKFRGRLIREVGGKVRHTSALVRQALFNMVNAEGKSFLDLFCGGCVVTIEAISRGAKEAAAVDVSSRAISICKRNLKDLGIYNLVKLYRTDARRFVESKGEAFDIVFMDPPYGMGIANEVLKRMREDLVKNGGIVIVEERRGEDIYVPDFLKILKVREYGDTELVVMVKP